MELRGEKWFGKDARCLQKKPHWHVPCFLSGAWVIHLKSLVSIDPFHSQISFLSSLPLSLSHSRSPTFFSQLLKHILRVKKRQSYGLFYLDFESTSPVEVIPRILFDNGHISTSIFDLPSPAARLEEAMFGGNGKRSATQKKPPKSQFRRGAAWH